MFETASGDGKIESCLAVREIHPTINQARGESIPGADPIYRMSDVKFAARQELLTIIQAGGPIVLLPVQRFAQADGSSLDILERIQNVIREFLNVPSLRQSEDDSQMFFIRDQNVRDPDHFGHHLLRALPPIPEIAAIIKIKTDGHPFCPGAEHSFHCQICSGRADCGSDARDMKPFRPIQGRIPGNIARFCQCHRAVFTVIYNSPRALIRGRFQIIRAETSLGSDDPAGVDAEAAKLRYRRIRDRIVVGQDSHICGIHAERRKRDGNIGFGTAKDGRELGRL